MPMKDTFGSQPPLELIRHWMDYGFFYDRQKQTIKYVNDILLLAAMGTPGIFTAFFISHRRWEKCSESKNSV
jgi:hypothetical protein